MTETPAPVERVVIPSDPKAYKRYVRQLRQRTEHLEDSGRSLLKKHAAKLAPAVKSELDARLATLNKFRKQDGVPGNTRLLTDAAQDFETLLDEHLGKYRQSMLREYTEAIFWAVMLTLLIRVVAFEAFKIPTGSMIPTLHVHDHLFVNKFIYGIKVPFTRIKLLAWRDPLPGEVIVFEYPYEDDPDSAGKDLIKRVAAVAGDKVHVADNVIHINGKPLHRKIVDQDNNVCSNDACKIVGIDCQQENGEGHHCRRALECNGGHVYTTQHYVDENGQPARDNVPDWPPLNPDLLRAGPHATLYSPPENRDFPDYVVPKGFVLVMGDNRDNSKDGRFFGLVPLNTIKGKAGVLWWAFDSEPWKPDLNRMFSFVHHDAPEDQCDKW